MAFPLLKAAVSCWNAFLSRRDHVIHNFDVRLSLHVFLLMTHQCCLFYIHFRLGKWCKTKREFKWFSYSSSKWVIKQRRQLTSTMHLAQELPTNIQCHGSSRNFAKETKALKMRIRVAGSEVDNDQLRVIIQVDPPKNSKVTILWLLGIWSKLER